MKRKAPLQTPGSLLSNRSQVVYVKAHTCVKQEWYECERKRTLLFFFYHVAERRTRLHSFIRRAGRIWGSCLLHSYFTIKELQNHNKQKLICSVYRFMSRTLAKRTAVTSQRDGVLVSGLQNLTFSLKEKTDADHFFNMIRCALETERWF